MSASVCWSLSRRRPKTSDCNCYCASQNYEGRYSISQGLHDAVNRENRTRTNIVGARDSAHGLAFVAAANRFVLLVRGELRLSAETFAGRLGARPALDSGRGAANG
jgi:hypothetical protein